MDGNLVHVTARAITRCEGSVDRIKQGVARCAARAKARRMPNSLWYYVVSGKHNDILGYICGQGVSIRTILGPDMVPHGTKL